MRRIGSGDCSTVGRKRRKRSDKSSFAIHNFLLNVDRRGLGHPTAQARDFRNLSVPSAIPPAPGLILRSPSVFASTRSRA
jgi:hypothetical protein